MNLATLPLVAVALLALAGPSMSSAQAVENSYRSRLTSAAFQPPAPIFKGDGDVTATLDGRTAAIAGDYEALSSPVTRARVLTGVAPGAPGRTAVGELKVTGGTTGTISGELRLSAAQVNLLKAGRLYVQIETEATPGGALWGWLMPNHRFPGENVPEKANWYAQ